MLMGGCQPIHQPSVCPPTVRHHFDCPSIRCHRFISQLRVYLSIPQSIHSCFSQHPLTVPRRFNHPLPVDPPTARLSVCPSAYPLLFFHQLSVIVSTTSCLSVCLSVLSCFFSSSTDCPSPFQSPTAHLSVCLSVCLSSLVFPPTVNHRFDRRLCVYSPTVCHHF